MIQFQQVETKEDSASVQKHLPLAQYILEIPETLRTEKLSIPVLDYLLLKQNSPASSFQHVITGI
jgi:hypothetical protein